MRTGPGEAFSAGEAEGRWMSLRAPAKLNLRLKITGKRSDGYHELVSLMVPVSLFDDLVLRIRDTGGIQLTCRGNFQLPDGPENLVFRAASDFLSTEGSGKGVSVELFKRIPVAAGLGGGSSDAASTLMGLNELLGSPLTPRRLRILAEGLGADVPFFLEGRPCIARGIGELLEPVDSWPEYWYVIVTPALEVSTAWVYRNLKLELTIGEYAYIVKSLKKKPLELSKLLENDLETVTTAHYNVVGKLKGTLRRAGALGALMSGSGPTVFGMFETQRQAALAADRLLDEGWPHVFVARGI